MKSMKKLTNSVSPLRYPGGKSRLAKHITGIIEANRGGRDLCSPFLGGASVELEAVSRGIRVHGYDTDAALVNFWSRLMSDRDEVLDEVEARWDEFELNQEHEKRFGFSFNKASYRQLKRAVSSSRSDLERGFRKSLQPHDAANFWTLNRMSYAGTGTAGGAVLKRYTRNSIEQLKTFQACPEHFIVRQGHYWDVIQAHENDFLYCDPPYYVIDQSYASGFRDYNHLELCALLSGRGAWVLSYNNSPFVRKMYEDFRIIDLTCRHGMGNWVGKKYGKADAGEVLIIANDVVYEGQNHSQVTGDKAA